MSFILSQIENAFTGSFYEAALKVAPTLSSFGHGKGLAFALSRIPVSKEETEEILKECSRSVVAGYCKGFTTKVFMGTRSSERSREANNHP